MDPVDRFAAFVAANSRAVIVVVVVLTAVVGSGALGIEPADDQGFGAKSAEAEALEYVQANYAQERRNVTAVRVVVRNESGNALSKRSLVRSVRFQEALVANETVNRTLAHDRRVVTFGVANLVALVSLGEFDASLAEQRRELESMDQDDVDRVLTSQFVTRLLSGQASTGTVSADLLLPTSYEPGDTTAPAHSIVVLQNASATTAPGSLPPDRVVAAQLAIRDIGRQQPGDDYMAVSRGIMQQESVSAIADSLTLLGPLALLFAFAALLFAYRDLLDVLLSWVGIVVVLVWTFGLLGWSGIPFNRGMVIVVILLTGLSIDYAIHVFMRYRERRDDDATADRREAMAMVVASVGLALAWVTVTTGVGFLSNVLSSFPVLREFGLAATLGIVSAFVVFTTLVPALKVELDELRVRAGIDARRPAIGSTRLGRGLALGYDLARTRPAAVLVVVLLVSTGVGAYGAAGVDTDLDREESLPESPPGWMRSVPEPFAPGEYTARESLVYANRHFQREEKRVHVLVRGDVTDAGALERVAAAEEAAAAANETLELPGGDPAVVGPVETMRDVAATDDSFNETFHAADTDGDGVPDQDLAGVYAALYDADPERAGRVVERRDGEVASLRLVVSLEGGTSPKRATERMRAVAAVVDDHPSLSATATGEPVVLRVAQQELVGGMLRTIGLAAVVIVAFLMLIYRLEARSATLGALTFLPVVAGVLWLFGTIAALGIPLTPMTAGVGSMALGLGVDYAIHLGERYRLELDRRATAWDALRATVTGTGGALLGSTVTTAGAFGVLALALLPGLRKFGLLMALVLVYVFLSSVVLFPSLLVVWTRSLAPPDVRRGMADRREAAPSADGTATRASTVPATAAPATDVEDAPSPEGALFVVSGGAIGDFSVAIRPGEAVGIAGPAGGGKSAVLDVLGAASSGGAVWYRGRRSGVDDRSGSPPTDALDLSPDRTVREHVEAALVARVGHAAERSEAADRASGARSEQSDDRRTGERGAQRPVSGEERPASHAADRQGGRDQSERGAERPASHAANRKEAAERASALCASVGLDGLARTPDTLDRPERARLQIACALATDPELLVVDGLAGMTEAEGRVLDELFDSLRAHGLALLVVASDPDALAGLVDRTIVVVDGRVVAAGAPDEAAARAALDDSVQPGRL